MLPPLDAILLPAAQAIKFNRVQTKTWPENSVQDYPLIHSESAYLLRVYATGIGVWMDVFDSGRSYQHGILTLVAISPLLLKSICALSAQQLSLVSSAEQWTPLSAQYYGESLALLRSAIYDPAANLEHVLVATIMLSSYELLTVPGRDYHRHFRGAKSFIEALDAYASSETLIRASFWIFARQDVGEAMNLEQPPMSDPVKWPKNDRRAIGHLGEDASCNEAVRLCGETVHFIFGTKSTRMAGKRWTKRWYSLYRDWKEWLSRSPRNCFGTPYTQERQRRYWFPKPTFASAMCYYHVSHILLFRRFPETKESRSGEDICPEDQLNSHAEEIIDTALSDMPASVLVTMVQPVFHAARCLKNNARRADAIALLEKIRRETGYHTESLVDRLKKLDTTSDQ